LAAGVSASPSLILEGWARPKCRVRILLGLHRRSAWRGGPFNVLPRTTPGSRPKDERTPCKGALYARKDSAVPVTLGLLCSSALVLLFPYDSSDSDSSDSGSSDSSDSDSSLFRYPVSHLIHDSRRHEVPDDELAHTSIPSPLCRRCAGLTNDDRGCVSGILGSRMHQNAGPFAHLFLKFLRHLRLAVSMLLHGMLKKKARSG